MQTCVGGEECKWLPAGQYLLEITYGNVNEDKEFALTVGSLVTEENVQGVDLFVGQVPAGEGVCQFIVDVPMEARNVALRLEGVTEWWLQSIHLANYDNYLLAMLFFVMAFGILIYGNRLYKKEHNMLLCVAGLGIIASLPLFGIGLMRGGDISFHFARINGIYEGLRTGQFPVRINPVQLEGYGYISGAMYPQLFLYFPAILKFFHVSSMLGMKLLIFGANMTTAFLTYFAVRRICHNDKTALAAVALYTLNPYRMINFYTRGAIGEGLAMVFLPLVLWGSYEILWNRRKKWWILTLGMTGVLSSHILSLELYALLILGEMIIWIFSRKKDQVWKRVLAMGKAALCTILLNFYFIGPFLSFAQLKPRCFQVVSRPDLCTLDFLRVFEPFAKWVDGYESLGEQGSMSVTLGIVTLVGICLFIALLVKHEGQDIQEGQEERQIKEQIEKQKGSQKKNHIEKQIENQKENQIEGIDEGKRCLVLGSLFLAGSLWVMPWERLLQIQWLENIVQAIQFPWRLIGVSAMLFSVVTAIAVTAWEKVWGHGLWLCVLSVLLLECGGYYGNIAYSADIIGKMEAEAKNWTDDLYLCINSLPGDFYSTDFSHITCDFEEHVAWMNALKEGEDMVCREPEEIIWTNYQREGLHILADVSAEQSVTASFPLHYYPGYRVWIDGKEEEAWSYMSLLTCGITSGEHHIEVKWTGTPFMRFCDLVTLGSISGFVLWQGIRHQRKKTGK